MAFHMYSSLSIFYYVPTMDTYVFLLMRIVGFSQLQEIFGPFSAKIQWNFNTNKSLLRDTQIARPCSRKNGPDQFHTWRRMLPIKESCAKYILWKVGPEKILTFLDNWTSKVQLASTINSLPQRKNPRVTNFIHNGYWKVNGLKQFSLIKQFR